MANEPSPRLVLEDFIALFNDRNTGALDQATSAPWLTIVDGKTNIFDAYSDMIDFDGLSETDWSYTAIGDNEVLHRDASTVFLKAEVVRFDADDQVIFSGEFVVLLARKNDNWKVAGWLSGGKKFSSLANRYSLILRRCCSGHRPPAGLSPISDSSSYLSDSSEVNSRNTSAVRLSL